MRRSSSRGLARTNGRDLADEWADDRLPDGLATESGFGTVSAVAVDHFCLGLNAPGNGVRNATGFFGRLRAAS